MRSAAFDVMFRATSSHESCDWLVGIFRAFRNKQIIFRIKSYMLQLICFVINWQLHCLCLLLINGHQGRFGREKHLNGKNIQQCKSLLASDLVCPVVCGWGSQSAV